jgi:DNA-binding CsgD family transcriptional regulator
MLRSLAPREKQVLRLLGAGYPPEDIAREVGISEGTVVWIVGNIVGEIGARSTSQLAASLAPRRWSSLPIARWSNRPLARVALPAAALAIALLLGAVALARTGLLHVPSAPLATDERASAPVPTPDTTATSGPGFVPGATPATGPDAVPSAVPSDAGSPSGEPTSPTPVTGTLPPASPALPPAPAVPVPTGTGAPAPSLPLPLPSLPTVPPLPTPPPVPSAAPTLPPLPSIHLP